jgi:hypothetical protein
MKDMRSDGAEGVEGAETALRLPRVVMPLAPANAAAPMAVPWRVIALGALLPWSVSRLAYLLLTPLAGILPQFPGSTRGPGFLGVWQRFDTNWYISIATYGYHIPQQIAFFPFFPALIKLFSFLTGGNMLVAALLVSNLSALAALIAVGGFAAWEARDAGMARWTMLALLIYPWSFFLVAAYTEGLFITFSALCLLFARQGRWRWAGVMALLAGATRPTGAALIIPLAWEWLRQRGLLQPEQWRALLRAGRLQVAHHWLLNLWSAARTHWQGVLAVAAVPAFILGLGVFAGIHFHHPLLIVNVRRDYWGLVSMPVWVSFPREVIGIFRAPLGGWKQTVMVLDVLCLVAATGAVIALARRMPIMYTLYMLGLIYLCVAQPAAPPATQVYQGPGRYLMASIPLFPALGVVLERHPRWRVALICVGLALQCYLGMRFMTGKLME